MGLFLAAKMGTGDMPWGEGKESVSLEALKPLLMHFPIRNYVYFLVTCDFQV